MTLASHALPHSSGPAEAQLLLDTVSVYLHIPFCHRKCHYCDFNTYAGMLGLRERYVDALRAEILLAGERARREDGRPRRCRTIFFGGGTPSLLTVEQVATLLDACRTAFQVDEDAEVSLEANPGALEYGHLNELRAAGVNRLSMGAQSLDGGLLKWLSRIHSPEDVIRAYSDARSAGFDNVNLDFMYALPGQSLATWADTLDRAIALGPDHLSLYSLIVEEHTPLHTWVAQGRVIPADEDMAADMYELAQERLRVAGYRRYEVSNWSRPGLECRHNLTYWHNLPYIGLGAGAHGWYAGRRYEEAKPINEYIERVKMSGKDGERRAGDYLPAAAVIHDERITPALEMAETAILGLRLVDGLDKAAFALRFGRQFGDVFGARLGEVRAAGLIEEDGGVVRLSARGTLLGNEVFERLLPDDDS